MRFLARDDASAAPAGPALATRHTVSAIRSCPAAVGWMPSAWFSDPTPPTPSSRNGTSAAPLSPASSG